MFGYVRIFKPQLRVCEYDAYKAIYCSLCRELGREYGPSARALLNYDFTFVAMLYMAVNKQSPDYVRKGCVFNPLKRCGFCTCDKEAFRLTSAMTAEMLYFKTVDNFSDSRGLKKLAWRTVKLLALPMRRRATKRYPEIDSAIAECMELQLAAEQGEDRSVDASAEPSARMISALAQMLSQDDDTRRILKDFGYYFGRWIYLIDAFDDIAKDVKSGSFNPFVIKFQLTKEDAENDSERLAQARGYANECLNMTVARAVKAFNLLDTGPYAPIFDNILYLGLGESQRRALREKELQKI